jgi:hypothetical protein
MGYFVNDDYFKKKKKIKPYIRDLLYDCCTVGTVPPKDVDEFLRSTLANHPEWLTKCNNHPESTILTIVFHRGNRCIELHRADETRMDISYGVAVEAMKSGRNRKPRKTVYNALQRFNHVARNECADDIQRANAELPLTCAITGVSLANTASHIDHVLEFEQLVNDFILADGIDVNSVGYSNEPWVNKWTSQKLTDDWKRYHRQNATLRRTTPHANLSRPRRPKRRHE